MEFVMKTEEDEAFDEIARKQGMWGGGFMAKKAMAADKLQELAQEPWISLTSEQVQECADNSYYHSAWSSEVDLALFAQNLDAALRKVNT
jgi:hypothetical protein